MDILKGMAVFSEVAKQHGFAPAARALNLSTSAVSRYVIDLEDWIGAQLFQRTTRKLSLTEEGKAYLERCRRVVAEVHDIQHAASDRKAEPQGPLRITAPVFIAKNFLQDLLPEFFIRFPKIELELVVVDRFVNLIEEGFDLAIRAGELEDSTLVARKLADAGLVLIAAPAYIEKYGIPKSGDDLTHHNCIVDTVPDYANRWPIMDKQKLKPIAVQGNIRVNSGEIVRSLALAGVGIALLPRFFVLDDIRNGRLTPLMEASIKSNAGIFVIYPKHRHISTNVRSFIDYLLTRLDRLNALSM